MMGTDARTKSGERPSPLFVLHDISYASCLMEIFRQVSVWAFSLISI